MTTQASEWHAPRTLIVSLYAALCELESTMQPHDGWPALWGESLQVDGWGPPFDGGCFLMGSLNGHGLSLDQPSERMEMTAEALLQLALTPLGARCDSPLPPAWHSGQRSQAYGSLGVAAWVYPERALIEVAARRLAGEMLAAWVREPLPDDEAQAAAAGSALLETRRVTLNGIAEALTPAHNLGASDLWRPLTAPLSLDTARRMRQGMDDEMARRLEPLATARPAMDRQAAELAGTVLSGLADDVSCRLDGAAAGRLGDAAAFLAAVEQRLADELTEMGQAAEARWRDMERVDQELARVGQRLEALGQRLPEASWRRYLATLVRPRRLWAMLQAIRDLSQLGPAYGALLLRQTGLAMEVLSHDLATEVYEGVRDGVAEQQKRVACLRAAATAAQQQVGPSQAPLCGALGFSLEQSVLTPELVEDLYRSVAGTISDALAELAGTPDRLSSWPTADPDGEDLAGVCLDFTRRRCRALDRVALEPLLIRTLGQEPSARGEVAQENRARVAIAGLRGAGKSTLLNRLEGWDVSPVGSPAASTDAFAGYEDLGMFVLIDLPEDEPESGPAGMAGDGLSLSALGDADLIVFLVDGFLLTEFDDDAAAAMAKTRQMAEYRWLCRLRALGRPLIPVLSKSDLLGERLVSVKADLERRLATSLVAVSALEDPEVGLRLLPRLLDAEPDLLVPLAGEIPALRQQAANRLIRQTALLSALTGLEPVPLLDLPLQLALQARLLLRLAAIYGQARPSGSSREMVAAAAGSLGLRYAVQQVVKLVPVLGWVVSGVLSGVSTYLIGRAAAAHYQGLWSLQVRRLRQARLPVATIDALTQGTAEVRNTARALPKQLAAHLPKRQKPGTELAPVDNGTCDVLAELGYATMEEAS